MPVEVGDPAPEFTALTDDGRQVSLGDFRDQTVVLYFYPRADTAGCTTQACEIRDHFPDFQQKDVVVLGCSPDTVEAQAAFKAKNNLPFTLLADPEHEIAEAYGVWTLREREGQTFWGVVRTTFVIGPDGRIRNVMRGVIPAGHAEELLTVLA
ncbi:MAG TPA: thioredoxin-dependent thiol peroxidase [Chloroflexota bacterium]|jgi:peroxiredoxin Q/BCP|nr:thioredoxin-dependent thiol peroxidase [Chloroflexota bacterium]